MNGDCIECGDPESVHRGSWQWCRRQPSAQKYRNRPSAYVPGAPCFQHDSYRSDCNDCREMNGVELREGQPVSGRNTN
jgi:hypothetical protein